MKVTRKDVETVAVLSRLEMDEAAMDKFTGQFNAILDYVDMLSKVDTEGVEPTAHVLNLKNVMRTDEVKPSLSRDQALSNAPEQEDGYFKVPKIIDN
ncbi:MAG: gatC [Firmicutes bacterium]|nr:gatC [Bacillota bacterium]